jgi:hypothetical protein
VGFSDVLADISERTTLTSNNELLRIYEKWLRTGSARDGQRLIELGIVPNSSVGSDSSSRRRAPLVCSCWEPALTILAPANTTVISYTRLSPDLTEPGSGVLASKGTSIALPDAEQVGEPGCKPLIHNQMPRSRCPVRGA